MRRYSVSPDPVKGSKFERSQPFRAAAEAGNIKLLLGPWNETECEQFSPDEREYEHDDQVDAACGAFNFLAVPQRFEYTRIPRKEKFWGGSDNDDERPLSRREQLKFI